MINRLDPKEGEVNGFRTEDRGLALNRGEGPHYLRVRTKKGRKYEQECW